MKKVTILYLYPNEMNIYGDTGNVLVLRRRLEWYGYDAELKHHHVHDKFNGKADIIVGGGGQDSGQLKVYKDLQRIGPTLKRLAEDGVPMLMICGLYQLFGHRFVTNQGEELPGISVFNAETHGSKTRLIGNVVLDTPYGTVVGYENHSGQTTLFDGQEPFGTVTKGAGNNGHDKTEGAIYRHVHGSYLHGSLLPKNPRIADELIKTALKNRYGSADLSPLDDSLANKARQIAARRPR